MSNVQKSDNHLFIDEGYIKYQCNWQQSKPLTIPNFEILNYWRKQMHEANLIGYDPKYKVGFGNISMLAPDGHQFYISGTQTGHLADLSPEHYAKIIDFDIDGNKLTCTGATKASSESLTHAVIYTLSKEYGAVIHTHDREMWYTLMDKVPTTEESVPYGTPEMAYEIIRLYKEENLAQSKIVIMAGHQDGVITFGKDLDEAAEVLRNYQKAINQFKHQLTQTA